MLSVVVSTGLMVQQQQKKLQIRKWTQSEIDAGKAPAGADTNTVKVEGLKTLKKEMIDNQCAGILAPSDWMYIKAGEEGGTMDSGWKTWRASVRTKCNSMQTQIDNAADVDALDCPIHIHNHRRSNIKTTRRVSSKGVI